MDWFLAGRRGEAATKVLALELVTLLAGNNCNRFDKYSTHVLFIFLPFDTARGLDALREIMELSLEIVHPSSHSLWTVGYSLSNHYNYVPVH